MAENKFVLGNALIVIEVEAVRDAREEIRVVGVFYDLETAKTHMNRYDRWEYDAEDACWHGWAAIGSDAGRGNYCLITPVYIDTGKLKEVALDA